MRGQSMRRAAAALLPIAVAPIVLVPIVLALSAVRLLAQEAPAHEAAKAATAIEAAFPTAPADWQSRLVPDRTMRACSAYRNSPPKAAAEAIAQSGYGLRFTDSPPRAPNGGNCYACHRLGPQELSYGTLGPSLLAYGRARQFGAADAKAAYEKIYDSQAGFPCSNMPRFGANKILTVEQIKDLVALLMSPDSPVNK